MTSSKPAVQGAARRAVAGVSHKPPRVMFVTHSLELGGTERHLAQIAPALMARGFDVTIGCVGARGTLWPLVAQHGIRLTGPPDWPRLLTTTRLGRALAIALGGTRLLFAMLRHRPDIAHFFLTSAYLIGAPCAALARVPIQIMSRRSTNEYQHKYKWAPRLERWLHRRMDLVLGNANRIARELIDDEGVPAAKAGVIYNGTDLEVYSGAFDRAAARGRLGLAADDLVLSIVANLSYYKGHADLLDALARIQPALPNNWRLLVIGHDLGFGCQLESQTRRLGLSEHVHFLGRRRDIPDLLRAADIGILASTGLEGFSNAIIEGMAAGLPMVVTDVGGGQEAVLDGVCGFVVPPRMPRALGAAILKLADSRELRQSMGAAARARAISEFSLTTCVGKYAAVYQALLAGQPVVPIVGFPSGESA